MHGIGWLFARYMELGTILGAHMAPASAGAEVEGLSDTAYGRG